MDSKEQRKEKIIPLQEENSNQCNTKLNVRKSSFQSLQISTAKYGPIHGSKLVRVTKPVNSTKLSIVWWFKFVKPLQQPIRTIIRRLITKRTSKHSIVANAGTHITQ